MANFNRVILVGNLTRDPELRYTPSGAPVCSFDLAVNRSYTTQAGERRDEVCYITIVSWGKQAETCKEYLKKGRAALIEGRLTQRSWETPEGQRRGGRGGAGPCRGRASFLGSFQLGEPHVTSLLAATVVGGCGKGVEAS